MANIENKYLDAVLIQLYDDEKANLTEYTFYTNQINEIQKSIEDIIKNYKHIYTRKTNESISIYNLFMNIANLICISDTPIKCAELIYKKFVDSVNPIVDTSNMQYLYRIIYSLFSIKNIIDVLITNNIIHTIHVKNINFIFIFFYNYLFKNTISFQNKNNIIEIPIPEYCNINIEDNFEEMYNIIVSNSDYNIHINQIIKQIIKDSKNNQYIDEFENIKNMKHNEIMRSNFINYKTNINNTILSVTRKRNDYDVYIITIINLPAVKLYFIKLIKELTNISINTSIIDDNITLNHLETINNSSNNARTNNKYNNFNKILNYLYLLFTKYCIDVNTSINLIYELTQNHIYEKLIKHIPALIPDIYKISPNKKHTFFNKYKRFLGITKKINNNNTTKYNNTTKHNKITKDNKIKNIIISNINAQFIKFRKFVHTYNTNNKKRSSPLKWLKQKIFPKTSSKKYW